MLDQVHIFFLLESTQIWSGSFQPLSLESPRQIVRSHLVVKRPQIFDDQIFLVARVNELIGPPERDEREQ